MAEEKKKGFWSWLGFGKKTAEVDEQVETSEQAESIADDVVEQVEQKAETLEKAVEEKFQSVSSHVENALHQFEEKIEQIESVADEFFKQAEQKAEKLVEIVEEKAQAVSSYAENTVQQFEEKITEKSEQVESFVDDVVENVKQAEQKTEELKETVEEKVQAVSSHAENAVQQFEEKITEKSEQAESFVDDVVEQVEQKAETLAETVEETTQAVSSYAENAVQQFEEKITEKREQAGSVASEVVEHVEQKAEELKETVEEKVQAVISHTENTIHQFEEKITETSGQAESIADKVVEKLEQKAEQLSEIVEEEGLTETVVEKEKTEVLAEPKEDYQEKPTREGGFFNRLIKGLIKTKQSIGSGFLNFFRGKKIDDDLFDELEEQLLVADLGMPTTTKIINNLTQHATKQQLRDAEMLYQQLKIELAEVLKPVAQPLELTEKKPYVILMVGVNGVGKTTTIGKLARKFQAEGKSVMLAAGDTFRAAAVEQLQVWGERNNIPVIAQATGSDAASVIFDAMQSAAAKGVDVLIADTAGRLQNKNNLMDELKKIVRVMKKYDETAPHEIMLTLDAGTGQNAISQAKLFNEAVGLTGITLTKLDGTAKGGVIFAIADQFNIPIRFIGVGEKIDDLRAFDADEFIDALFTHEDEK